MTALLSSTYFGPVQWYQKLYRYPAVLIEQHDSYRKQTYRNRCVIATTNGLQPLTVPVTPHSSLAKDVLISDHGNWRHLHWHALMSAYSESPFFEYYADDLHPFFERRWKYLYEFNLEICKKICELLDIRPEIRLTSKYVRQEAVDSGICDFREAISPKHPQPDPDFRPRRYYQVYERKHGFQPNLSILDLLFNMGPESIFYL